MVSKYTTYPYHHGEQGQRQYQTQQHHHEYVHEQQQSHHEHQEVTTNTASTTTTVQVPSTANNNSRSSSIAIRRKLCDWELFEKSILYNEQRYTHATWMMYSRIADYRERNQSKLYCNHTNSGCCDCNENNNHSSDEDDEDNDVTVDAAIEDEQNVRKYSDAFSEHLLQRRKQSLASILTDVIDKEEMVNYQPLDAEIFDLDL
jgi:hypothetical protein